ncbi:MerR family transcriptional regulator [Leucobacter ruminantium]|uniref:MerR family transcriptional regulator n=1 Tax=Leucobacter ruminantium TaxID=1289170 RepID=A0A939LWI7_9MICO|nr:MerR family transcriptional regulator [Leucobacter ruminantium]MBO1805411.1 MerR family transcriptional regulator [Leucobacter ruminantium]
MRIGELSRRTGASVRSLRYYEECGLIEARRSSSGQRRYEEAAVGRVVLIRRLLSAGLGTAAIADVLPCMARPESQTARLTARLLAERDRLTEEIQQRVETRAALERIIEAAPPVDG